MTCPHCGKEIFDNQAFCQYCGGRTGSGSPLPTTETGGRKKTAWEDRDVHGFFGGILRTIQSTLFSPTEFFRTMTVTGGLTEPLLFSLIIGMVGLMISYLWQILLQGTIQNFLPPEMSSAAGYDMFHGLGIAVMAILSPVAIILWLFIWSGIVHLCLMLVRGARQGFEATFRAVAYSHSTYLFMALPFCGGIIAAIWSIVLIIIGLKEAHEISGGKASFAELFPIFLCCGVAIMGILFLGLMAASVGALMQQ